MKKEKKKVKFNIVWMILLATIAMVLIAVYNKTNRTAPNTAEEIMDMLLQNPSLNFVDNTSYDEIKASLKTQSDFCIYIEDEQGNIILSLGAPELKEKGVC